jgi:DNA modification methylase
MLVMKELKRILKKTGTLFWNMGDTYSGAGAGQKDAGKASYDASDFRHFPIKSNLPNKSLMMIPERFTMAMIDDGWILRNKIVWYKRNGMPSSVKDRLSNKWEYVFFFTKSQKYYFDLDSIRKPLAESSVKRISQKNIPNQFQSGKSAEYGETSQNMSIPKILNNMHQKYEREGSYTGKHSGYKNLDGSDRINENGANPGDVIYDSKYSKSEYGQSVQGFIRTQSIAKNRWQSRIDAEKLYPNDPQKQAEYIKLVHDHDGNPNGANPGDTIVDESIYSFLSDPSILQAFMDYLHDERPELLMDQVLDIPTMPHSFAHFAVFPETLVEPLIKAGCPSDGIVLDPFAGSGTVGVVAMKQNKNAILIEISPEYCNIIKKRLNWGAGLGVEYESFPMADVMEALNE